MLTYNGDNELKPAPGGRKPRAAATRQVGIFRSDVLVISETFISAQAQHLERFHPTFIARSRVSEVGFDTVALADVDRSGLRRRLFGLFRWPWLFGGRGRFPHLDLIHAHFGPDGVMALPLAQHLGVPLVVTFHGYDATIKHRPGSRRPAWLSTHSFYRNEAQLQREATGFIAVSHFIKRKLVERGYPEHKIFQHYIGVDTEAFVPATEPATSRYVFCVGRHVEKKGLAALVKAFARVASKHPDVKLVQVGSGPESEHLHALTRELGLEDRVEWLGARSHPEVMKLMQHAEVFALTSETAPNGDAEGLGIVFNEASAMAVPIIATLHGGIPEAVRDGETGLLAPEGDVGAIAAHLDYLLSDPARAKQMGLRGRQFVCDHFDLRKQSAKLEDYYARIADGAVTIERKANAA